MCFVHKGITHTIYMLLIEKNCYFKLMCLHCFLGSIAHKKLKNTFSNKKLVKAIKQASSVPQTSFLEGYHLVVNHFPPKMIHYSYSGMVCR